MYVKHSGRSIQTFGTVIDGQFATGATIRFDARPPLTTQAIAKLGLWLVLLVLNPGRRRFDLFFDYDANNIVDRLVARPRMGRPQGAQRWLR